MDKLSPEHPQSPSLQYIMLNKSVKSETLFTVLISMRIAVEWWWPLRADIASHIHAMAGEETHAPGIALPR